MRGEADRRLRTLFTNRARPCRLACAGAPRYQSTRTPLVTFQLLPAGAGQKPKLGSR
jgi:hypothetical protein